MGADSDLNAYAGWLTIAPDWEYVPARASFELFPQGRPRSILATTRSARLLPKQILEAAGMPFVSTSTRTVNLTYRAILGSRVLTSHSFSLTFGPADATADFIPPPQVPPVVTGATIPVTYDLTSVRGATRPALVIFGPGVNLYHQGFLNSESPEFGFGTPEKSYALAFLKGTIQIPVSALRGGGIYALQLQSSNFQSPFGFQSGLTAAGSPAFVRVQPSESAIRPVAPLLSVSLPGGSKPSHSLEMPYGPSTPVQITYRQ